ncbi:hypothetical protein Kpol_448p4 [Vanderwaltozyma polyspora DSM 70294]|uniref:Uncharacterized protein n=1 Tax=Vanderwaltozyma polyspora (strain ATCC 22028 / DSM 70294 / BCRC 21397 / CBS 2163 / NBRC 10782 / NRRL Y-8283 / UCD 57-17) TaxID=436907 RepID=A7TQY0_VANPO|nr:uncharacterized protein Kpol_448p4 [Vanderwaltozyma polyspora DSM 70294]EDO15317.1 hypothetical protein Kpol_448p4 [Vanderwaltozyma polyspora DSM 70294]
MTKTIQRCVFIRHGETKWSKTGHYTGKTDLTLTEDGVAEMERVGKGIFEYNLVNPDRITHVFVSPRTRAQQSMKLVLKDLTPEQRARVKVTVDEDIQEWDYGDYEGLMTAEIEELRKKRGLDKERPWSIWRDGCENGESTQQIGKRLSRFIARVQKAHSEAQAAGQSSDILVFAHGHSLRYFAALWFMKGIEQDCEPLPNKPEGVSHDENGVPFVNITKFRYLNENPNFLLCAGGVGALGYSHYSCDEPALDLSGAFIPPLPESSLR